MILGAHEGVAGGVSTAFARAEADGADCLQIFTRNVRGWAARPFEPAEVERFRAEARRTKLPVAAHSTYLVNLCAADAALREKSWEAKARLLIETTAGQGSSLGWNFEQVAAIREAVPGPLRRRVGVCVDTCHLHAAGCDLASEEGYHATFEALDRTVGLARVEAFHLNDCKKPRGCRVDRHEHIGEGEIGLAAFRWLVNDPRFADVPAFLETELRFKENLAVLRSLKR